MSAHAKLNFRPALLAAQPAEVNNFFDNISSAIHHVWTRWAAHASLGDVRIEAGMGTGGRVSGPDWGPLLEAQMPPSPFEAHWKVVASVLGAQWNRYQNSIAVPGLPLWPAFRMVPAPQAPPTPNTPVALTMLAQNRETVSRAVLREHFLDQFPNPAPEDHALFDALAGAIEWAFDGWQTSTSVKNVIGTGPVPSFSPPKVPAGSVVGGVSLRMPGTFA